MHNIFQLIIASSLVTFLIRSVPFIFFRNKELPDIVMYLGKYLPYAMMPLLVVFALRNTNLIDYPFGLPEIIASLAVIILHLKFNKLFLSIGIGTLLYMALVQFIFI